MHGANPMMGTGKKWAETSKLARLARDILHGQEKRAVS
jgi:hypothetical protein